MNEEREQTESECTSWVSSFLISAKVEVKVEVKSKSSSECIRLHVLVCLLDTCSEETTET